MSFVSLVSRQLLQKEQKPQRDLLPHRRPPGEMQDVGCDTNSRLFGVNTLRARTPAIMADTSACVCSKTPVNRAFSYSLRTHKV